MGVRITLSLLVKSRCPVGILSGERTLYEARFESSTKKVQFLTGHGSNMAMSWFIKL